MLKRIQSLRLYQKILIFSIVVVLLAVLLSGMVYYRYTANQIMENFTVSARDLARQSGTALTAQLNNVVRRSNAMLTNRSFSLTVTDYLSRPDEKSYTAALGTIANFLSEMVTNELIVDSAFVHTSRADFDDFSRIRNRDFDFDSSPYAQAFADPDALPLQWLPLQEDQFFTRGHQVIPFVWRFSLAELATERAYLVVQLNPENLRNSVMEEYQSVDEAYILAGDGSLLIGNKEKFARMEGVLPADRLQESEAWEMDIQTEDGEFIAMQENIPISGWHVLMLRNKTELLSSLASLQRLILITAFVLLVFSVALMMLLTGRMTRSIHRLARRMNTVRDGDLTARFVYPYRDEIGELADSFNYMLDEIQRLMENQRRSIEDLRLERNRVSEIQKQKRKAELQALQAQINPHFLYNTLNTITWQAVADGDEKISRLSTALGRFFRLSLAGGAEVVTVRDELEHARNYLLIQQIRYGEKLEYEIDAAEELMPCPVLKLILQPLVENAIYHGIKLREGTGHIRVCVRAEAEDRMIFTVKDDGVGIPSEQLTQMNEALSRTISRQTEGYGIYNVNERLRLFYGEECGLRYESEVGRGTRVTFVIPRNPGEEEPARDTDNDRG